MTISKNDFQIVGPEGEKTFAKKNDNSEQSKHFQVFRTDRKERED